MAQAAHLPPTSAVTAAQQPLRFVTATALYDGHDAAINVVRRLLIAAGAEVVHLGHNRSVEEIARTAVQEDADAVAVSSYQGGHMEFFPFLMQRLADMGADHVAVFAGGGGTITGEEARSLQQAGLARVYLAGHGRAPSLDDMVEDVIERTRQCRERTATVRQVFQAQTDRALAVALSRIENSSALPVGVFNANRAESAAGCPVVGITGTGGAGKSSLTDELIGRLFACRDGLRIACLAVDPTQQRSGGALLADRLRINHAAHPGLYFRSMATRRRHLSTGAALGAAVAFLSRQAFDLVLLETVGIGQADATVVELADISIYVMTADFGAESQLDKIEMLSNADLVAVNKLDRPGAQDALAAVRAHWLLEHPDTDSAARPAVFGTCANRFGDAGVDALFERLCALLADRLPTTRLSPSSEPLRAPAVAPPAQPIPTMRCNYLAEIAAEGREIEQSAERQVKAAAEAQHCYRALEVLGDPLLPAPLARYGDTGVVDSDDPLARLRAAYEQALDGLDDESVELLRCWPLLADSHRAADYRYRVRDTEYTGGNYCETLSGTRLPKIVPPATHDWGEQLRFLLTEHLPGHYPYTAGVFPHRRTTEDPARMFAGEGIAERTNCRFHFLCRGQDAIRLSTAFDPIVLYGEDPSPRPDVYGRIGMSGVSVATLDDFKRLYSGFDLCQPQTSVSMTINGPGPIVLASFLNAAIDQQVERWLRGSGNWPAAERRIARMFTKGPAPVYRGELPPNHDGLGLELLGVSGAELVDAATYARIRSDTLKQLRGTLQADILKEDQAQNECLFPIDFALRLMGDVQSFVVGNSMRNYYSVSVSGYHIAEAGANPVTQLAFTLANGFTLVEYFLAHGLPIDAIAPHLSFFFSNGLDAEYAVIGRVARRIWARAMRCRYRARRRSQQLKYHIQTSGRSLHARDFELNDIRTTLEALYALNDNCNSLHTNAADEAMTTPTEQSVRRALAIQLIINRELGLNACENLLQGSHAIETLTGLVERAVYREFDRLSERGGVLVAMENGYQRRCIQEQSLYYEQCKADGRLPIVGVNTFIADDVRPDAAEEASVRVRSTDQERRSQIDDVAAFKRRHAEAAHQALTRLEDVVAHGGNVFDELMDTVRVATLGQITQTLYRVGGRYRRSL